MNTLSPGHLHMSIPIKTKAHHEHSTTLIVWGRGERSRADQMGRLGMLCFGMMVVMIIQVEGDGNQMFRVGGLDAWALPTTGRPDLYENWAANIKFKIGDALLFLYPPSQDLVVQVGEEAYSKCDISSPIAKFNDGNSYFSFNYSGYYYFTSGRPGNCAKSQKLAVAVADTNGVLPPLPAPSVSGYIGISPDTAIATSPAASATSAAIVTLKNPADSLAFIITLFFGLYMLLFQI